MRYLLVTATLVALVVAPAGAAPFCTPDGDWSEWQIQNMDVSGFGGWNSAAPDVYWAASDDRLSGGSNAGGEWYDIEALYLKAEVADGTQYVNWALFTSYGGVEARRNAALPNGVHDTWDLRNGAVNYGSGVEQLAYPYRRHPVLALSFDTGNTWSHGIIMAPGHDWQYGAGTNQVAFGSDTVNFDNSHGLTEVVSDNRTWAQSGVDANGAVASISDASQLWYTPSGWRDGHPNEFGTGTIVPDHEPGRPIDFDVSADSGNSMLTTGDVYAGNTYAGSVWKENTRMGSSYWQQTDTWFWEGCIELPSAGTGGVDLGALGDETIWFSYGMYCANNTTFGDALTYGAPPPGDDSPEASTWALLLCTVALGSFARRRRN